MSRLYQSLWAIYLISYPIAVIGVAFDVRPGFSLAWAGSVLLFLQGALASLWLARRLGAGRGGWLALAVGLGAFAGETVGVATHFPFGPYSYTTILFPASPGTVPLPVIGAWLLVVITSVATAQFLLPAPPLAPALPWPDRLRARWRQLALATVLGVALDLVLEPVAVHVEGYWVWHASGPYYGIPTANFLGWAVLCAVLSALLLPSLATASISNSIAARMPSMLVLYALTCAMFAIVDLTHGLWLAGGIGMGTFVVLAIRARATYDMH